MALDSQKIQIHTNFQQLRKARCGETMGFDFKQRSLSVLAADEATNIIAKDEKAKIINN